MAARFSTEEIKSFVNGPRFDPMLLRSNDPSFTRLSVVMPSYNQDKYLERAILSVLNQNYPNLEFIMLDGGSCDRSVEIIKTYADHLSFWTSERDGGQSAAINRGFAMATGRLIAWQNSDDVYLPGFFHRVDAILKQDQRTDLLIANSYCCDAEDRIVHNSEYCTFSVDYLTYVGWNLTSQATFVDRAVARRVGPMREDIAVGFDWDWYIRIGRSVRHPALLADVGGCYRLQPDAKFATFPMAERDEIEREILRRLGLNPRSSLRPAQQWPWRQRWLRTLNRAETWLLYRDDPLARALRPAFLKWQAGRGTAIMGF
jgi:glycosyltransferase involved in cell wall biosynthesis